MRRSAGMHVICALMVVFESERHILSFHPLRKSFKWPSRLRAANLEVCSAVFVNNSFLYPDRTVQMTIKVGDKIPETTLMTMGADGPGPLSTGDIFAGKTVALFSVPGAFTPTCSAKHLPGFVESADQLKAKGIDTIACISVNDVFVMDAWGKAQGVEDNVLMLADGNGDFTKAIGLDLDASGFGMGQRAQRYSMVVKDGAVTHLNIEGPGDFKVSSAQYMLDQL